jgi:hypothetical protein
VEGWSEQISRYVWNADLNLSPAQPWGVWELADASGDTDEFNGRLDAAETPLAVSKSAGATSLQLSEDDLWTTDSDDFPLDLSVGGYKVTASAITAPWTFVAFGTSAAADAAAISPGLPTGWAQGDLLLLFHATRDTTFTSIPQVPAGYTNLVTSANMRISYKYATSSESAPSATYSGGSGDTCLAIMAAVRPATTVSGATIASATQLNGSAQNIDFLGLAANAAREIRMYFGWKADDSTAATDLAGFDNTTRVTSTLGNDATIVVGVQPFSFPYDINDNTVTITGGAAAVSRTLVASFRSTTNPLQVATTSALPAAVASGSDIRVWQPPVLAL